MTVTSRPFGTMPDSTPVERIALDNDRGTSCELCSYGAVLLSIRTPDRRGRTDEVTLCYDRLEDFLSTGNPAYFGATVGRYANRIAGGRFTLEGVEYTLQRNEKGIHHLHGGVRGFDKRVWAARPYEAAGSVGVELTLHSSDGEEGYPGDLEVIARYELDEEGRITMRFEARASAPTPVNIVNHAYYNLAGRGSGSVLGHELQLHCSRYVEVDETLLPTGLIAAVEGTPFDFRSPGVIGERIAEVPGGYDHCYVVDRGIDEGTERPAPVAVLRDPGSGREMRIASTQPGVQLYTGNFLEGVPTGGGSGGGTWARHDGVCLETQCYPDSPNRPEFPSAIVRPGKPYVHTTVHAFSAR